jgi:hypothetical protein
MALAKANSGLAWDEWKKNTLAYHAEAYPNVWYGIWSGPDTYNSELSKYPGQTVFKEPTNEPEKPKSEKKGLEGIEVSWTDFPVMNMHPHAWPLYNIPSLLGITFTSKGVHFAPVLPLKEYQFTSPLVDFIVRDNEISGKYQPLQKGEWQIQLKLPPTLRSRFTHLEVNGLQSNIDQTADLVTFAGVSTPDKALIWKLLP